MVDMDFSIPHDKLKEIFIDYRIRTEWVVQLVDSNAIVPIEMLRQFTSHSKYVIGMYSFAVITRPDYEQPLANMPHVFLNLVDNYDLTQTQGQSIVPFGSVSEMVVFPPVIPYQIPIWIVPKGIYTDTLGQNHVISHDFKGRIDTFIDSGKKLIAVLQSDRPIFSAVYVSLLFAEGTKRY
jgi:hypothetical protein